jgi:N-acyl-D-aspartate/D-glutamate deacylase
MLDVVLRGGTVIDGSGRPGVHADVGVRAGRIVAVGAVDEPARRTLDVTDLVVAPGIVDPHTHYDAQLCWDPTASPSSAHGVTTVLGGNCGFSLAPVDPADAGYLRRLMARVEGMSLAALETGVDWSWRTFGEYLDRFEGRIAVNAGFLVGHCALRRVVLGADASHRIATDAEVAAMRRLLGESLAAGGLGFSSSQSYTHSDGDGNPVPSRAASTDEVLALCAEVRAHPGTVLEYITDGCLDGFSDDEVERLARMSHTARRPLNWNVLSVDARAPERVARQLRASDRAAEIGGRVFALTMPTIGEMNMSFATFCALWLLPGWGEVFALPVPERIARLCDPATRRALAAGARSDAAGVIGRLAGWGGYVIGDTFSAANAGCTGRTVADLAAERGADEFDTLLDLVIADELRTVLWPRPTDDDEASWRLRATLWEDPRVLLGGSDAGAHLDRMCAAPYPTAFLADCLRGRRLVPVETAVRLMTAVPAEQFGLLDRGRVAVGAAADLVVFDPASVAAGPARSVADLPGGGRRLVADPIGVPHVLVAGVEVVADGVPTDARPGTVLRSGVHTATVAVPAGP